jgi:MtN3 and saliva related transmembrane protein
LLNDHVEILGLAAGFCTSLSLLPQLIKLVRTKKSEDLSLFYLGLLLAGLALWIWYGVLRNDFPVIATNSVALILNLVIIILGIRYKENHATP